MSENQNNQIPAQPVYIMQPQAQQPQTSNNFGGGLGGIIISTKAFTKPEPCSFSGMAPLIPRARERSFFKKRALSALSA